MFWQWKNYKQDKSQTINQSGKIHQQFITHFQQYLRKIFQLILADSKRSVLIFVSCLEVLLIIRVVIPFFIYNNLYIIDMVGHYAASWYLKEYLFPAPFGWNPFFYAGYPQDELYQPLFHYIVALLSFPLGLHSAFKLIVSISVLLIPIAAYYLALKFQLGNQGIKLFVIWVWAVMWLSPSDWGGNLTSAFNLGEVTNLLAVSLFFCYIGCAVQLFSTRRTVIASILLTLIILCHIFAGIAAVICFLGLTLAQRTKRDVILSLSHLFQSFLLASFWIFPLFINRSYTKGVVVTWYGTPAPFLLLTGIIIYFLFVMVTYRGNPLAYSTVLILLCLLVWIQFRFVPNLPIHFQRFKIYAVYLVFFPIFFFLKERHFQIQQIDVIALLICALVMPQFNLTSKKVDGYLLRSADDTLIIHGPPDFHLSFPRLEGRVFSTSTTYGNLLLQYRALSHIVPMHTGNLSCVGLFVDSAVNGAAIQSIQRTIDAESILWGPIKYPTINPNNLTRYLQLYHITYVLSNLPLDTLGLESTPIKVEQSGIDLPGHNHPYKLFKVPPSELIEVLDYTPLSIKEAWDENIRNWWGGSEIDKIFVYADHPMPPSVGQKGQKVKILENSERWDYIKFQVNATQEVPILIKISEYPRWKAYKGQRELKIYRASPYLMLVYGHGTIELKYEMLWYNKFGYLLSIIGMTWAGGCLIKSIKTQSRKAKNNT